MNADKIIECNIVDQNVNIKGLKSTNFSLLIETATLIKEDKNKFWLDIQSANSKEAAEKIVSLLHPLVKKQLL